MWAISGLSVGSFFPSITCFFVIKTKVVSPLVQFRICGQILYGKQVKQFGSVEGDVKWQMERMTVWNN